MAKCDIYNCEKEGIRFRYRALTDSIYANTRKGEFYNHGSYYWRCKEHLDRTRLDHEKLGAWEIVTYPQNKLTFKDFEL